jgi:hypothetical protein
MRAKITFGDMRKMGVRGVLRLNRRPALIAGLMTSGCPISYRAPLRLPSLRQARRRRSARLPLEQAADRCDGLPMRFCARWPNRAKAPL